MGNGNQTTDVGQNQLWATQFLALNEKKQMLTSGGLGTMGYGFPAAIGAKLGNPKKSVVVISGDGGMQMNIQEMATAVVYEIPIIICILNNGYLGNVRQWQEMFYHRHYSGTCMRYRRSCEIGCNHPKHDCPKYTPDFVRLAESYGAKGIRVTKSEDIETAFETAKQNTKTPTVIEFIIDREINVMPIVPPGNALSDMILEREENGKSYNLDSLTVGITEDSTISRMTISLTSDDKTFEQIKKQLNRSVEVIKVVDYTDIPIHMKEILFVKVNSCSEEDIKELFRISRVFGVSIIDYDGTVVLLECTQTENKNNDIIVLLKKKFINRIEIVRGGSVAVEAISISER